MELPFDKPTNVQKSSLRLKMFQSECQEYQVPMDSLMEVIILDQQYLDVMRIMELHL